MSILSRLGLKDTRSVSDKQEREQQRETAASPAGALNRFSIPARRPALSALSLGDVSSELLARLAAGERYASDPDLVLAEQLYGLLGPAIDVHLNRFAARRYADLLRPILDYLPRSAYAGGTVVDLGSGSLNPFVFGFLFLTLGAQRACVVDLEPPQDLPQAMRALATAAGWMLIEPARVVGAQATAPMTVIEHLHGFDLGRLAAGDPAGLDADRLVHRVESIYGLTIADASVDLVSSVSLLEHVDSIDAAMAALYRIIKPGGWGHHVIDFVDHRSYSGEVDRPLAFLEIESLEPLVYGCNRLRCGDMHARFAAHGFVVERVETWPIASLADDEHRRFVEPYRSMAKSDVMPAGARFFVRRPQQEDLHRD